MSAKIFTSNRNVPSHLDVYTLGCIHRPCPQPTQLKLVASMNALVERWTTGLVEGMMGKELDFHQMKFMYCHLQIKFPNCSIPL